MYISKYTYLKLFFLALLFIRCESEETSVKCDPDNLKLELVSKSDAICGQNNGELVVRATGGAGGFIYTLSNGDMNSTGNFGMISAGSYIVSAEDVLSCRVSIQLDVENLGGVQFSEINVQPAGCGTENGSIQLSADSGTPPYAYALDGGTFVDDASFASLEAGEYLIRIRDANDCEISQTIRVPSGISLEMDIVPLVEENCAVAECHGGNQLPDFRLVNNIVEYADRIRERTADNSMPPNTVISQEAKALIACWVDDGVPEN